MHSRNKQALAFWAVLPFCPCEIEHALSALYVLIHETGSVNLKRKTWYPCPTPAGLFSVAHSVAASVARQIAHPLEISSQSSNDGLKPVQRYTVATFLAKAAHGATQGPTRPYTWSCVDATVATVNLGVEHVPVLPSLQTQPTREREISFFSCVRW